MDLSAVAGSPAFLALQTLAAPSGGAGPAASAAAPDAAAALQPTTDLAPGANAYAVSQGLGQALSAADAASSAGHTVLGLLGRMRDAASQAAAGALSSAERETLDQGFQADAAAVAPSLAAASVGGVNLVDGSLSGALKVPLGDGAQATLGAIDLRADGPTLGLAGSTLLTGPDAAAAGTRVASAIQAASGGVATLQAQAGALAAHAALVQSVGQASAGSTAPAADGDGMRLLALQVSQQLSGQSGAIANAAPQQILALFRP